MLEVDARFLTSLLPGAELVCVLSILPRSDQPHINELIVSFVSGSERRFLFHYSLEGHGAEKAQEIRSFLGTTTSRMRSLTGVAHCIFTDVCLSKFRQTQYFIGTIPTLNRQRRSKKYEYPVVLCYQSCTQIGRAHV